MSVPLWADSLGTAAEALTSRRLDDAFVDEVALVSFDGIEDVESLLRGREEHSLDAFLLASCAFPCSSTCAYWFVGVCVHNVKNLAD